MASRRSGRCAVRWGGSRRRVGRWPHRADRRPPAGPWWRRRARSGRPRRPAGALPNTAAVVRGRGGAPVTGVGGVEDQAAEVPAAVRAEADPAVGGALEGQATRCAVGERQRGPGEAGGGQGPGAAVGPAALPEDADRVARINRDVGLFLGGRVGDAGAVAVGVRITGRGGDDRLPEQGDGRVHAARGSNGGSCACVHGRLPSGPAVLPVTFLGDAWSPGSGCPQSVVRPGQDTGARKSQGGVNS